MSCLLTATQATSQGREGPAASKEEEGRLLRRRQGQEEGKQLFSLEPDVLTFAFEAVKVTSTASSLQKWSKGKVRDKLNNLVLFDKPTYDKLYKEVPSYKLITPSVVSERLKIRGSLARAALQELLSKGQWLYLANVKCVFVDRLGDHRC